MIEIAGLTVLLALGVYLGWLLPSRPGARRIVKLIGAALVAGPLLLILLASLLDSEPLAATLGWAGGLSLMIFVACVPIVALAAFATWLLIGRRWDALPKADALQPAAHDVSPPEPSDASQAARTHQREVVLVAAGILSAFWVVITIGFWINEDYVPGAFSIGFLPAFVVLIATTTLGVRKLWRNIRKNGGLNLPSFSIARVIRESRASSASMAARKAWIASMEQDPKRRRYADMLKADDLFWTPERVEYDLDQHATTCCEHLAPVESALRAAGIIVRLHDEGVVNADCCVDALALKHRLSPAGCVAYQELHIYDRSIHDPPSARIACTVCPSCIWVQHPQVAATGTPVFP